MTKPNVADLFSGTLLSYKKGRSTDRWFRVEEPPKHDTKRAREKGYVLYNSVEVKCPHRQICGQQPCGGEVIGSDHFTGMRSPCGALKMS